MGRQGPLPITVELLRAPDGRHGRASRGRSWPKRLWIHGELLARAVGVASQFLAVVIWYRDWPPGLHGTSPAPGRRRQRHGVRTPRPTTTPTSRSAITPRRRRVRSRPDHPCRLGIPVTGSPAGGSGGAEPARRTSSGVPAVIDPGLQEHLHASRPQFGSRGRDVVDQDPATGPVVRWRLIALPGPKTSTLLPSGSFSSRTPAAPA